MDALVKEYDDPYQWRPICAKAAPCTIRLREAARIELGLRAFLKAGDFKGFTTTFEDLHGLKQLPGIAVQRLMADGYGFGAEGDWKTAALLRAMKVMADGLAGRHLVHGGLHLSSRPEGQARSRRAHAGSLPVDRGGASRRSRSIRWASAARQTRCGWCSMPPRGRR